MLKQITDSSQTTNQQAKSWKLIYTPALSKVMRELDVHHPAEATVFINQLAFWMQTNSGHVTEDGKKWIYNSYAQWTQDQIESLSPWQFGQMIRDLQSLGIIEKTCYAHLKNQFVNKPSELWHPYQTHSWITLDLERCQELTGYNPIEGTWKSLHSAEIANATTGDCNHNDTKLRSQQPSIYRENSISTQNRKFEKEKDEDVNQENKEVSQWDDDYDPWDDEVKQDTHDTKELKKESLKDEVATSVRLESPREEECSAAPPPDFEKQFSSTKVGSPVRVASRREGKCPATPGLGFKKKSNPSPDVKEEVQEIWEIAPGRPYGVFLNWRADKKYKPQGGKWEADARGNAYAEFYNNREKTTVVIFPEFLEYMQQVAQNCNQQVANGIKAILPSCFVTMPEANHQNVKQVMVNIQELVDKGAQVALPTSYATPSCTQSMTFAEAAQAGVIKSLPNFQSDTLSSTSEPEINQANELLEVLKIKQIKWKNVPAFRTAIKRWAEETPGIIMTSEGPKLELE
ncbi:hypothetical protein ANSO36C_68380 (plasmid) [Nostoc cf. commune SO-36]|uniref:Uncharacterized protein n=1 Tax=Nostoc cf. commune SO-36 TaxID=449208 RepID=A0ABN6QD09_NOSCO|nr:hypothetical protein [Nostoc commune]BDI21036.1 hypothetical protein ANSO36C_68380 [Nostoc cf. commune SO-36]